MTANTTIHSRAYLLAASDIDTDQVFPSRFQNRVDGSANLAPYFFHDQRFDANGAAIADAPLNDSRLRGACIIISPRNYACGSARPGAVFAHRDFGIRVLISASFGQVFPTVCYKFGVVPITLPSSDIAAIVEHLGVDPITVFEIDFEAQAIRYAGASVAFDLDEHVRDIAVSGHDELDLTMEHLEEIERFERARSKKLPWLIPMPVKDPVHE